MPVAPITPNFGGVEEAIAGSSAIIFTATERKVIEERGGLAKAGREFIELFKDKPLTTQVENEETNVRPQQNPEELVRLFDEHCKMLKHSAMYTPRDKAKITNKSPDQYQESDQRQPAPEEQAAPAATQPRTQNLFDKTVAMIKELKFNPAEFFNKMALEQEELHSLISQIKELHLKRLFTESAGEFDNLTASISRKTLAAAKPEAKPWLTAQLNQLALETATYKLNLLTSLQAMEFNPEREGVLNWLKQTAAQLAKV